MTSFGDKWLGDETFAPVMEELNRRKAIVYTHPSVANCCRNVLPNVHYSVVELSTDTTPAIANLVFSGTAARFPDIRFIFSHAGGTMPFIYQRFVAYPMLDKALGLNKDIQGKVPAGVLKTLQSFYYDTAQAAHPMAMKPLANLVSAKQILFGTDFPFRTLPTISRASQPASSVRQISPAYIAVMPWSSCRNWVGADGPHLQAITAPVSHQKRPQVDTTNTVERIKSPGKSTPAILVLPLITVWLEVRILPGPPSIVSACLFSMP
jgi:hypothetical protein